MHLALLVPLRLRRVRIRALEDERGVIFQNLRVLYKEIALTRQSGSWTFCLLPESEFFQEKKVVKTCLINASRWTPEGTWKQVLFQITAPRHWEMTTHVMSRRERNPIVSFVRIQKVAVGSSCAEYGASRWMKKKTLTSNGVNQEALGKYAMGKKMPCAPATLLPSFHGRYDKFSSSYMTPLFL
jgi:hypothetical protein